MLKYGKFNDRARENRHAATEKRRADSYRSTKRHPASQARPSQQPRCGAAYAPVARILATIGTAGNPCPRSEENTSELQSLMRISYSVFCYKIKQATLTCSIP